MYKLDPESKWTEAAAVVAGCLTGLIGLSVGVALAPFPAFSRLFVAAWACSIGMLTGMWGVEWAKDAFMTVVDDG